LHAPLAEFFDLQAEASARQGHRVAVVQDEAGFSLSVDDEPLFSGLPIGDVVAGIGQAVQLALINDDDDGYLSAGLIAHGGRGVLIVGADTQVRDDIVAWLIASGFAHGAQSLVRLDDNSRVATGFSLPLTIDATTLVEGGGWGPLRNQASVLGSRAVHLAAPDCIASATVDLVILASRAPSGRLSVKVPTTETVLAASQDTASTSALRALEALLAVAPVLSIEAGRPDQLRGVVDVAVRMVLDNGLTPADVIRFHEAFSQTVAPLQTPRPAPERSTRQLDAKLTIGMATYDDYDGVYFSIQAIRLYHPEILDRVEFIVIDNNPTGVAAMHLKAMEALVPNYRYIPAEERVGTAVRDLVFREAAGEFVLCIDSHVLLENGAIAALLDYFEANPESVDLIQGPMVWENMTGFSSHWEESWRRGMLGVWAHGPEAVDRTGPAFDIPMQGLGLFACRRDAWLGFNPTFKGFGGEEGYIHAKFRQNGARTLCLPALRWVHRFARPRGVPYAINWHDRFRNYLLGRQELGLPNDDVIAHINDYLGQHFTDKLLQALERSGEIVRPTP